MNTMLGGCIMSIRAGMIHQIIEGKLTMNELKEVIYYSGFRPRLEDMNKAEILIRELSKPIIAESKLLEENHKKNKTLFNDEEFIMDIIMKELDMDILEKEPNISELFRSFSDKPSFSDDNKSSFSDNKSSSFSDNKPSFSSVYDRKLVLATELVDDDDNRLFSRIKASPSNIASLPGNISDYIKLRNKITNLMKLINKKQINISKNEIIDLERVKYDMNKYGIVNEKKVIKKLNNLGLSVECTGGLRREIGSTGIQVNGKPDGIFTAGEYKGCYLEVKSKPAFKNTKKDYFQICTYHFLTGKDIILVNDDKKEGLVFKHYKSDELSRSWIDIEKTLINKCQQLCYLLSVGSLRKFRILRDNMKSGIIKC